MASSVKSGYSEFIKDIYSSLKQLSSAVSMINVKLDIMERKLDTVAVSITEISENMVVLDSKLSQIVENGLSKPDIVGGNHILSRLELMEISRPILVNDHLDGTVKTGLITQSDATAFSLNSHPPGMCLELSGNGIRMGFRPNVTDAVSESPTRKLMDNNFQESSIGFHDFTNISPLSSTPNSFTTVKSPQYNSMESDMFTEYSRLDSDTTGTAISRVTESDTVNTSMRLNTTTGTNTNSGGNTFMILE